MNPCPLDGTDQLARHVLAACVEPDGPVDVDGDQACVIDDARHPAFLAGGEAARPWDAATGARVRRPRRRRCSWPRLVAPLSRDHRPAVPGVVSMSVPPPPNGVRGATRAMGRHGRRVARADETRDRRPDVGLRASLRQMVTP